MAVVNLTCDFPNEYSIPEIARWVGVSVPKIWQLVKLLNLDVRKQGKGRVARGNVVVNIPLKMYQNKNYEPPTSFEPKNEYKNYVGRNKVEMAWNVYKRKSRVNQLVNQ